MANDIDVDELHKALKMYDAARSKFDEAKRIYKNTLDELETARNNAYEIFEKARNEYYKASDVFSKFTDEHLDPDEEDEEEEEEEEEEEDN